MLERFGGKPTDLTEKEAAAALAQRMTGVNLEDLAKDVVVGTPEGPAVPPPAAEVQVSEAPAIETPVPVSAVEVASEAVPPAPASEVVAPAPASEVMHATPASEAPVGVNSAEISTEVVVAAAPPVVEQVAPRAVKEPSIGTLTLRDILSQLARPGRDPREDLPAPVFKHGVLKLEDLTAGMELTGTVLNVVDFGCFVDIGMHDSGLVHVSRLADRFIRDPHEVVAVGDVVKVWVMEVDKERRRVSLTMVRPGSERARRPARGEGGASSQDQAGHEQAGQERAGQNRGPQGGRAPRSGQGRRGGRPEGQQSQQGGQQGQQAGSQSGRPQSGRPQGGRPQGGRPYQGGRPQQGGAAPQGGTGAGRRRPRRQAARGPSR